MSFLIKGVEMPQKCGLCPCFHAEHPMYCQAVPAEMGKRIVAPYEQPCPDWCPLVEVPTPHGRLIDADEADSRYVEDFTELTNYQCGWNDAMKRVCEESPTIIPAEED